MVEIREKLKFSILYLATITTYITDLIIVAFISFLFYAIFCSNNEKNIYLKKKLIALILTVKKDLKDIWDIWKMGCHFLQTICVRAEKML